MRTRRRVAADRATYAMHRPIAMLGADDRRGVNALPWGALLELRTV